MTFQEALTRKHVPYRQGAADRAKISICCVFCEERGKPADAMFRLCVHATQGWGKCVHCGWKWKRGAAAVVLRHLGVSAGDVVGFDQGEVAEEVVRLPADFLPLANAADGLDRRALRYLLDRGVTREQVATRGIGVSYSGRYAYRIVFPVMDGGQLAGIVARDFTGASSKKYLNSKGEKHLWGFDAGAHSLILSEGVFKALRIAQVTRACSAAVLGHDLTPTQLAQIKRSRAERVTIYPDTDAVGRRGAAKIADALSEEWGGSVRVAWPVARPADEATLEEIHAALAGRLPYAWATRQLLLL